MSEVLDMLVQGGAEDSDDMSSDEARQPFEVVFDQAKPSRRKSSFVDGKRPGASRNNTFLVHGMLEEDNQDVNMQEKSDESLHNQKSADKQTAIHPSLDHMQSRLLTKKQLSDMAFGIRELSKRLGRVRLMLKVKNIFILTKAWDASLIAKTADLSKWLLDQHDAQYTVYVEDKLETSKSFDAASVVGNDQSKKTRLKYWNDQMCQKQPHKFDIILALGGDGTVLYASLLFQRVVPPVLSFAMGSLGFLTKFDYSRYTTILPKAFNDGITVSLRLRFEGTVMRCNRRKGHTDDEHKSRRLDEELIGAESDDHHTHHPEVAYHILNEIVIDRGPSGTMTALDLFGDEELFTTIAADGLIVATPTGSTAYNLAAGGSLCHPDNPVMLLTAIAAHTLNFRPIILPDTMVLRVGVPYDSRTSAYSSFDGRNRTELRPGDYVTISASRFPYPSVLPPNKRSEDWMESISRSLAWNTRIKQKPYSSDEKKDDETRGNNGSSS